MTSSPSSKAITLAGLCTTSFGLFAGEALAETLGVVGAALADTLGLGAASAAAVAASAAFALALALLEGRPRGMLASWQVYTWKRRDKNMNKNSIINSLHAEQGYRP
mgnify:CR=1 FL=1